MERDSQIAEREAKALKRQGLQEIVKEIKAKKSILNEIGRKWWDGEKISLREKETFYHTRLFIRNLEAERLKYLQNDTGDEYVTYHGLACRAETRAYIEEQKRKGPSL
jgi:hypothetical protein